MRKFLISGATVALGLFAFATGPANATGAFPEMRNFLMAFAPYCFCFYGRSVRRTAEDAPLGSVALTEDG